MHLVVLALGAQAPRLLLLGSPHEQRKQVGSYEGASRLPVYCPVALPCSTLQLLAPHRESARRTVRASQGTQAVLCHSCVVPQMNSSYCYMLQRSSSCCCRQTQNCSATQLATIFCVGRCRHVRRKTAAIAVAMRLYPLFTGCIIRKHKPRSRRRKK